MSEEGWTVNKKNKVGTISDSDSEVPGGFEPP